MLKNKLFTRPIDDSTKRVELLLEDDNGDIFSLAEMHPKQAEDLLKVYNRTDEQYDNLYPSA